MEVPQLYRFSFAALGSPCALHLYAPRPEQAQFAAHAALAEIQRIEARYSRYHPDSDLSAINRAAALGESITLDEETAGLLDFAAACHAGSGGLFDITSGLLRRAWDFRSQRIPDPREVGDLLPRIGFHLLDWRRPRLSFLRPGMELDFGGLGKEYAADRAAETCVACGIGHGLIDLGGDLRAIGPHPDGAAWRVGVRHPLQRDRFLGEFELSRGALATSGDYERCIEIAGRRYGHVLDPRTGWPVAGLRSVTALADGCLVAGTVCTIAMLKGAAGPAWLQSLNVAHLWMDDVGRVQQCFAEEELPIANGSARIERTTHTLC